MLQRAIVLGLALAGSTGLAAESAGPAAITVHEIAIPTGQRSVRMTLAVFAASEFSLHVVNNSTSTGTARYATLGDALPELNFVAGCNGGFFNQQPLAPVGLLVADGARISPLDSKNWMKAILVVRGGKAALEHRDNFLATETIQHAIQTGPWLVRGGRAETDNGTKQVARRTFIGHDQDGRWVLGYSDTISLHDLALALRSKPVTSLIDLQEAANLDGGPSSGLWVRQSQDVTYRRESWPVQNYVAVRHVQK